MTADQPAPGNPEEIHWRKPIIKAALMLLILLGLLIALYQSPLHTYLQDVRNLSQQWSKFGVLAPLVFMGTCAILVAIGCPRLILCPIGGMAFGFWEGLFWSQLGTLLGCYAIFSFVRWGGRDLVLRFWPKAGKLHLFFGKHGLLSVIVIRQLPLPSVLLNVVFGLSPARHRDFLLGTVIGILPEAIPCTLIGSSAMQGSFGQSAWQMGLAIGLLVAVWIGLGVLVRVTRAAKQAREIDHVIEEE